MTLRALALGALLALALAAPAQAGIVAPEDAAELAQTLAEAQEEQDICYGWAVGNNFDSSGDLGNSRTGPNQQFIEIPGTCPKGYVVLNGDIRYACESCESEDSASVSIDSNLPDPPTVKDLESLGLKAGDLTGDKDDTTLINMVNALPLLAAERGNAPYVAYEEAKAVPAQDHPTDKPGSDFLRDAWLKLVLFGGLVVTGPMFFLYKRGQTKSARAKGKTQANRASARDLRAHRVPPYEPSAVTADEPGSAATTSDATDAATTSDAALPTQPLPTPPTRRSRSPAKRPRHPPPRTKDSAMDYWEDLATELGAGLLYGLVGIALLALGYRMIDALTPGHLGRQLCEDRNRNAGVITSAAMLSVGIIVTSAIIASDGDLAKGLGQSAGFGLVGILLLGVAFVVVDLITPGKLGDIVMGEDGHEPMVFVTSAALLSIGGIVAAAIS